MKIKYLVIGGIVLLLMAILAACQPAPAPTAAPVETTPCPTAAPCPECPACPAPEEPVVQEVPYQDLWANSPHNDVEAEAFNHWNEEDPAEVPTNCANCHTTQGYQEFVSTGSVANAIPAPAGTIQCVACHNDATAVMDSVTFPGKMVVEEGGEPQNIVISGLGAEARCMVCHQGRASKSTVDETLARFNATEDLDTVPEAVEDRTLGFINIHYYPAAATLYGTLVKGGYEYDGKSYDAKNDHVEGYDTCIGCHNSHSLELKLDECKTCHANVGSVEDLRDVRMAGSAVDYDGDGDLTEGVAHEIEGLQAALMQNIQAYAKEVGGAAIAYNPASYPYFFADTNEDGEVGEDEASADNAYMNWTGRLVKAAYNYQMSVKDPGSFAHGGKYIIQLLYDSIEDLNGQVASPIDMAAMNRLDPGHFAGSEEAFRHWDAEGGMVPADCAKCHSATGLPIFLANGRNIAEPASNGLNCATCHDDLTTFTRYTVDEVRFPSGKTVTFGEAVDANLCLNCHQGRESSVSVNAAITAAGVGDDEVSEALRFRNPHYFAAGATLFGNEVEGAYQYEGKEYNGRNLHVQGFQTCTECHNAHALKVEAEKCSTCHPAVQTDEDLSKIRISTDDFDGDGDVTEGLALEVQAFQDALLPAIQQYVLDQGLPAILYNAARYPYWFEDTNANGELDGEEAGYANWTPRLLRSAYNFQWAAKDPGAFAHNGKYILQVLYDSLEDLGADVGALTRPEVTVPPTQ
jgi:hypothetical protein